MFSWKVVYWRGNSVFSVYILLFAVLRLRVTQKALQLPLFSSLSFSPQQIWTDWRKFLVELPSFVRLEECGLIWTHCRNIMWQVLIPIWNFFCENMKSRAEELVSSEGQNISYPTCYLPMCMCSLCVCVCVCVYTLSP